MPSLTLFSFVSVILKAREQIQETTIMISGKGFIPQNMPGPHRGRLQLEVFLFSAFGASALGKNK